MSFKQFEIEGIGQVTVYKRRGVGTLRLSVRHDGSLRVTIPLWAPYTSGVTFARSQAQWISDHAGKSTKLQDGQQIGKAHHLRFVQSGTASKVSTRIRDNQVVVTAPRGQASSDETVQAAARQASLRALRVEAERLLPSRLQTLAEHYGLAFASVSVRQLKSRWGSCDQDKHITLNIFLMQLPWELIDYVLLHELTHTQIMKHGPEFWDAMSRADIESPVHRKAIRAYRPAF